MRKILIASATVLLFASCRHLDSSRSDDATILTAALRDSFLQDLVGSGETAYLEPVSSFDSIHQTDFTETHGAARFQGVAGEAVDVAAQLLQQLAARNRRQSRLYPAELGLPEFFGSDATRHVTVSLPAVSADGHRALVALTVFTPSGTCPTGYLVLLGKTASGWSVHARGQFWIV